MFAGLLRNIAITGVAYGVVSGVGLLLAPFLIAIYGLAGYGQILIARTFLPSGFFALFDVGLSENTTRQVASARASASWDDLASALGLFAAIAVAIGIVIGICIFMAAEALARWFSIAAEEREGFILILRVTAALQPLLLLSLVAEGVIKGFERFDIMRSIEVVAAICYAGAALWLGASGLGANWIAGALLASLILRLAIATVAALRLLLVHRLRFRRWSRETRRDVGRWSLTMLSSKVVGILQNQIAGPLIGLLFNPAALGLYDVVVRLPRFAKIIFGLISTTVLPLASRVRHSGRSEETGRLAYYGMLGAVIATWPVAITCAAFSRSILNAWINSDVGDYWIWQSLMFAITMLAVPLSFGSAVALADQAATRRMVQLAAIQTLMQFPIAFALIGVLGPWSFVVGQAIAVALTFPFQYLALRKSLHIVGNLPLRLAAIAITSLAVAGSIAALHEPANVLEIAILGGMSAGLGSVVGVLIAFNRSERREIAAMLTRNAQCR